MIGCVCVRRRNGRIAFQSGTGNHSIKQIPEQAYNLYKVTREFAGRKDDLYTGTGTLSVNTERQKSFMQVSSL